MTRRSETCRPAMLGMLDMLSTTFMTRDPGQRITRHYGLSGDRLETECGSRQTVKPVQGVCGWSGSGSEARAVPRRSRGSREWSIRLATYSSGRWIMKKVFSSSNSARLPMSHRHGFARRTPHRQSTCHRLSASSRIYSILHGWWMVRRQSAPEGHGTCFRRSTVRCLKIVAPSAALHRDPQCVSGYRTLGFQISFDQED